jgi:Ca2+-binding EF-hand superfamily protein
MAMSDFRRKKLLYVFSTFFDVDNSGGIDDKDFATAAERLCRVHGWNVSEGKGAEVLKRLLGIWEALRQGDSDGDNEVDKDEWCALWEDFAKQNGGPSQQWQQLYKDLIFDLHDSSGDGSIGEDEFTTVNTRGDVTASDCKEAFSKISKNNSVEVTRDVYTQLWKEYFTSDDVNTPGNFIFGKLNF